MTAALLTLSVPLVVVAAGAVVYDWKRRRRHATGDGIDVRTARFRAEAKGQPRT